MCPEQAQVGKRVNNAGSWETKTSDCGELEHNM